MRINRYAVASSLAVAIMSTSAIAREDADLGVGGSLSPGACSMDIDDRMGDLGKISRENLNADEETEVQKQLRPTLQVHCAEPGARFAINVVDNRAGTAYGDEGESRRFGLGESEGKRLGAWTIVVHEISSNPGVQFTERVGNGAWTSGLAYLKALNGYQFGFTYAGGDLSPVPVTGVIAYLLIKAYVAPLSQLPSSDDFTFNGSATFELEYI